MSCVARVRGPFVECRSNIPYNLPIHVSCC